MKLALIFSLFLISCSSGPSDKKLAYKGEPLSQIGNNGLLSGHVVVPLDRFPHDQRSTVVSLENTQTKKKYHSAQTQDDFFLKLPPGDYVVTDLALSGACNTSTGIMISNFFAELPMDLSYLRSRFEKEVRQSLTFKVIKGKKTDVGQLLMTCMDWNERAKFKEDFASYIQGGRFEIFKPLSASSQECSCKILRKFNKN